MQKIHSLSSYETDSAISAMRQLQVDDTHKRIWSDCTHSLAIFSKSKVKIETEYEVLIP